MRPNREAPRHRIIRSHQFVIDAETSEIIEASSWRWDGETCEIQALWREGEDASRLAQVLGEAAFEATVALHVGRLPQRRGSTERTNAESVVGSEGAPLSEEEKQRQEEGFLVTLDGG